MAYIRTTPLESVAQSFGLPNGRHAIPLNVISDLNPTPIVATVFHPTDTFVILPFRVRIASFPYLYRILSLVVTLLDTVTYCEQSSRATEC